MGTQTTIVAPINEWTLLNTGGAAAGAVSIYPIDGRIFLKGTTSVVAPSNFDGAFIIETSPGAIIDRTLAELWPGMAAQHVYAYADHKTTRVAVSCA